MALLVELGDTMVDSGDPVTHVRDTLERVAEVNGVRGAEIIVLPTALIITLPGMEESRTEVASTGESTLRLDQVEAVFTVADAAERGEIGPRAALVEIRSARDLPPSFGPAVIVAGHAVIAMGLAIILVRRLDGNRCCRGARRRGGRHQAVGGPPADWRFRSSCRSPARSWWRPRLPCWRGPSSIPPCCRRSSARW